MATMPETAMQGLQRIPPQNLDAEQSVLGATLLDRDAISRAAELLRPEHFYRDAHRRIFDSILKLYEVNEPVDLVTLTEQLNKDGALDAVGGPAALSALVDRVPTAANVEHYAQIVRKKALLRDLISVSSGIVQDCYEQAQDADDVMDMAEGKILQLGDKGQTGKAVQIKDMMHGAIAKVEEFKKRKTHITGLATGFTRLDELTLGLQDGELIIVAARPGMGKTALVLNIAKNVAENFHREFQANKGGADKPQAVAIFSMEMSSESLLMRLLSSEGRINGTKLRSGRINADEFHHLTRSASNLYQLPIFIDDSSSLDIQTLRARARRMVKEHRVKLIVVDYLQLMSSTSSRENRQQEVSEISRNLKAISKELSIPVLVCSQLSRAPEQRGTSRKGERPKLSDLRESGAIEQDADVVMFIYRDSYYGSRDDDGQAGDDGMPDNIAEIIIAKQRSGPTDKIDLVWLGHCTRFEDLAGSGFKPPS